ncbi:MAG: GNAT family N-acetyltransferase, partial [Anaerolineae bacterium]|nr:GNAT family N-acetyltransferase [Anaerolineae bacterium]
MKAIDVRLVANQRERRVFLHFPWRVYRDDPLWIPPLLPERARAMNPARGDWYSHGTADFFIAWRGNEPVGTVCAATDSHLSAFLDAPQCVFGFFECVDDDAVAAALFDHLQHWASQRGIRTLYGPFNLDYENAYGVLIEGRDRPPALLCGHTPPYYRRFFEQHHFQPARGDNLAYERDLSDDAPELQRLARLGDQIRARRNFTIRGADLQHWQEEVDRVHTLLNQALAHLPDHVPWSRAAIESLVAPFLDIADPELILFAEAHGEPVGWLPGVPNLNEAFGKANGLRHPWDYARLWLALRKSTKCLTIKSVLVRPDYWDTGVAVLLFAEMVERARSRGYKWLDLSLTS